MRRFDSQLSLVQKWQGPKYIDQMTATPEATILFAQQVAGLHVRVVEYGLSGVLLRDVLVTPNNADAQQLAAPGVMLNAFDGIPRYEIAAAGHDRLYLPIEHKAMISPDVTKGANMNTDGLVGVDLATAQMHIAYLPAWTSNLDEQGGVPVTFTDVRGHVGPDGETHVKLTQGGRTVDLNADGKLGAAYVYAPIAGQANSVSEPFDDLNPILPGYEAGVETSYSPPGTNLILRINFERSQIPGDLPLRPVHTVWCARPVDTHRIF